MRHGNSKFISDMWGIKEIIAFDRICDTHDDASLKFWQALER